MCAYNVCGYVYSVDVYGYVDLSKLICTGINVCVCVCTYMHMSTWGYVSVHICVCISVCRCVFVSGCLCMGVGVRRRCSYVFGCGYVCEADVYLCMNLCLHQMHLHECGYEVYNLCVLDADMYMCVCSYISVLA